MDWRTVTGVLAGVITVGAMVPYIAATIRRTIRPSPLAWGGGALISAIAFAAQMTAEPSWSAVLAGTSATYCALVTVLALRNGAVRFTWADGACGGLGLVVVVAWQVADSPELALALAILADAIICLPMIRKTVRDPSSELSTPFLIIGGASLLGAVSAVRFDFPSLAWPVYLAVLNFLVGVLALRGQGRSVPVPQSR